MLTARKLQSRGFRQPERAQRQYRMPVATAAFRLSEPVAQAAPVPKDAAWRSPGLLSMARGKPCLLRIPGVCNGGGDTTVAAHSNMPQHGKGKARKAHDCYSVWACSACHVWYDQGPATRGEKRAAFMAAHLDQVLVWRAFATQARSAASAADVRTVLAALERLGATPTGAQA